MPNEQTHPNTDYVFLENLDKNPFDRGSDRRGYDLLNERLSQISRGMGIVHRLGPALDVSQRWHGSKDSGWYTTNDQEVLIGLYILNSMPEARGAPLFGKSPKCITLAEAIVSAEREEIRERNIRASNAPF